MRTSECSVLTLEEHQFYNSCHGLAGRWDCSEPTWTNPVPCSSFRIGHVFANSVALGSQLNGKLERIPCKHDNDEI